MCSNNLHTADTRLTSNHPVTLANKSNASVREKPVHQYSYLATIYQQHENH